MRGKHWQPQAVATVLGVLLLLSIAWALLPDLSAGFGLTQPKQLVSDA